MKVRRYPYAKDTQIASPVLAQENKFRRDLFANLINFSFARISVVYDFLIWDLHELHFFVSHQGEGTLAQPFPNVFQFGNDADTGGMRDPSYERRPEQSAVALYALPPALGLRAAVSRQTRTHR